MKKSLIVAMTESGVIGNDDSLPWSRLPGDLPRFRQLTMGKPCIMGRRTFEHLPRPLDGRLNIVVSRNGFVSASATVVPSILEAWIVAAQAGCDESFIIGGAEVYKQALPACDRVYLTIIDGEFDGDTKLETTGFANWSIISRDCLPGPPPYRNLILERGKLMATHFLTLERLPRNSLPAPRYGTPHSAGLDFSACLTRPCKLIESGTGKKTDFWVARNPTDSTWARLDLDPEASQDDGLSLIVHPDETILVSLGFKCAFDNSCVLKMYPRSSIGLKGIVLANGTGIIDPDYRGELFAALINRTVRPIEIKHGERIVQGVLTHFSQGIVLEGKVDETIRGEGGLGSTGQMVDIKPSHLAAIQQVEVTGLPTESEPVSSSVVTGPDRQS